MQHLLHKARNILVLSALIWSGSAAAQTVDLVNTPNLSKCTGDSLKVTLTIGSADFQTGNQFKVLFDNNLASSFSTTTADTLDIVKWESVTPPTAGTSADTNAQGVKHMWVLVPSDITINGFYSLAMTSSNPVGIWSDTIDMTVSVAPESSIDSIFGGFENAYTPINDWGLCEGDTITLYAVKGMNSYQWYSGGAPITGEVNDSLLVFSSGAYSVEVSSGNCFAISEDTLVNVYYPTSGVSHNTVPTLTVLDKDSQIDSLQFCETDTITLTGPFAFGSGTSIRYQWLTDSLDIFGQTHIVAMPGDTNQTFSTAIEGVYYVQTTHYPGGCMDTSYGWNIFVDTIPDTYIINTPWPGQSTASLDICPDDSTLLQSFAVPTMNDWSFQWEMRFPYNSGNWTAIPGDTLYELQVDTVLIADTAQFRLYVSNASCEYYTAPVQVNVIPIPNVQVAPGDSVAVCAGDSILIGVIGSGLTYNWTWPTGSFSGTSFYAKDQGTYIVEAIGVNNCTNYDTMIVHHVTVTPDAGPDQVVLPGETVNLQGSGGDTYYWYADKPVYFSNPYDPTALTRPTADTTMYILEVMTDFGCFGTDTMIVIQWDPSVLEVDMSHVMNFISPNGDGKNDVLDLSEVVQADSCDIVIMDRWGNLVYDQKQYVTGWNGITNGGDELPNGTYYFILMCNDHPRYRGAVTVVRNVQ